MFTLKPIQHGIQTHLIWTRPHTPVETSF